MQASTASSNASWQGMDEAQLRELVESCTRTKGPYHLDTIQATSNLASWLVTHHKPDQALPLARQALEHSQRMLGRKDHVDLLPQIDNLGLCLRLLDQFEEEEGLCIKALDITQRARGPEDPDTILCCQRLATCQVYMGKHEQAEALQRRVVDFNTRLLGPEDPQTVASIRELGECLIHVGKMEEAASTLHRALELHIRVHGMRHADTIICMVHLGRALHETQDLAQAERMLRRAIQIIGPQQQAARRLCAMTELVVVLDDMGRHDEAEVMAHGALEECMRVLGPGHVLTVHAARLVQAYAPPVAPPISRGGRGGSNSGSSSRRARR